MAKNFSNQTDPNMLSKHKEYNYLKYWRVIRQYTQRKYGLKLAELEILLFLYSEKYFSKTKFNEFDNLVSWDVHRFDRLLRDGWISVFRHKKDGKKNMYELSYKAKVMIINMYRNLDGREISVNPERTNMFKKNVSYTDKVYRNMIIKMNAEIREKRHQVKKNKL